MHGLGAPSDWVTRWAGLVPAGGSVLDLACGGGRHLRWFAARGHPVCGVDRDVAALASIDAAAELIEADIEAGPWPLADRTFDAVIVTNYLWRPLLPAIVAAVAPGGVLLYETYAQGQQALGKPSRPDFLLCHGELLQACSALRVIGYEDGYLEPPARLVQRIAACRVVGDDPAPARRRLPGPC